MTAASEVQRVTELYEHTDPDAPQSAEIEDLVARAAEVAGVPMATLNLLDAERQCQPATVGFDGGDVPRRDAMCDVTLRLGRFVHVPDARADERFAASPWVDGRLGEVRFYASAPLLTARGYVIGTLCVFDIEPHELSEDQIARLRLLAAQVVETFEGERGARR
jgi:GAF domain-containing protein